MHLDCAGKRLDLTGPAVMGVLNLTPDSFSGDGLQCDVAAACARALAMQAAGAAVIDVGGESTRPGAARVSVGEELRRVLPVIERLAGQLTIPICIDTRQPQVMRAAVAAGVGLINDVAALREPGALFNHSAHVTRGIGCESCHGRVDKMEEVYQAEPLNMAWCLDCHRNPEKHLRPVEALTEMGWDAGGDREAVGARLREELNIPPSTDCSTCHR